MSQKCEEWRIEADKLGDEMEKYAKNYKCKKCDEFYCSHMLNARGQKFRKRCDEAVGKLVLVSFGQ